MDVSQFSITNLKVFRYTTEPKFVCSSPSGNNHPGVCTGAFVGAIDTLNAVTFVEDYTSVSAGIWTDWTG